MYIILSLILASLFYCIGVLFLTADEVREPAFRKLYFAPFYKEVKKKNKLFVTGKLQDDVKMALSWYFIAISVLIPLIIFNSQI